MPDKKTANRKTEIKHHEQCEGHIECPSCGDSCAKPVVWYCCDYEGEEQSEPKEVLCLGCFQQFSVYEVDDA